MDISNNETYSLIKQGLKASTLRGKVIANNMANINTKEYKKSYVTFEENFKNAKENFELKQTKTGHIKDDNELGSISIKQDKSTSMRTDGNNVDLDLEKVNQASNTLMYNALITQANGKLNSMKNIIAGGR
ncbi:flagellar basal body rod protein FlgB [Clostridium gasigenes]|uniref:flagellar basal body rod protein FlgB n=1 Tax=Clostridium gasigenes TaxID=94869 RepID=UPI0014383917|nr:flagellar basal body rod protein FlgB [Clostridium gasigenes]NKF06938.1 flagellar basal body rod protein FlgB [Clostridium gasigenes]QSW19800.1 flagellar basal body rod protein FlgB [Clostridium gasigenes]